MGLLKPRIKVEGPPLETRRKPPSYVGVVGLVSLAGVMGLVGVTGVMRLVSLAGVTGLVDVTGGTATCRDRKGKSGPWTQCGGMSGRP